MYKLKEPKRTPTSDRIPYYIFVTVITSFLVWMMLIRPMTLPADKMPFIFVKDPAHNSKSQKTQYFLGTALPFLFAGLFMIPVVRNSNKFDYANAKIYANWEYLEDGESTKLHDMLKPNIIKNNGADEVLSELQRMVDSHKGKHIAGRKYFKKSAWDDLVKIT